MPFIVPKAAFAAPPLNSVPEPPTPENRYAHTAEWAGVGYNDGTSSFYTHWSGIQNDVFNYGATSSRNYTILSGDGDDFILTGTGKDSLYGQDGNDTISSGGGADLVLGGAGNDHIDGGSGADQLWGGTGNDTLIGGTGSDQLAGGSGSDTFIVDFGTTFRIHGRPPITVDTMDTIRDFRSVDDAVDAGIAGTLANYGEARSIGVGLAAARAVGEAMIDGGKHYAFVTDGHDGYLFVDRPGDDPGVLQLDGLTSLSSFGYYDLV